MSQSTITDKSLVIRNETDKFANTRGRVADVIDDINETKANKIDVANSINNVNVRIDGVENVNSSQNSQITALHNYNAEQDIEINKKIEEVVGGYGVNVDNTNPKKPIVSFDEDALPIPDLSNYALKDGSNAADTWQNASIGLVHNPTIEGKTLVKAGEDDITVPLKDATFGTASGIIESNTDVPEDEKWFHKIKMLRNNSDGFFTEIATSITGDVGMYYRRMMDGTLSGWIKLIDSNSFGYGGESQIPYTNSTSGGFSYSNKVIAGATTGGLAHGYIITSHVNGKSAGLRGDRFSIDYNHSGVSHGLNLNYDITGAVDGATYTAVFRAKNGTVAYLDDISSEIKDISANYTILESDRGKTLRILANVIITMPTGLSANFELFFIVQGNFTATFQNGSGFTAYAPGGMLLKQGLTAMFKRTTNSTGILTGNLVSA